MRTGPLTFNVTSMHRYGREARTVKTTTKTRIDPVYMIAAALPFMGALIGYLFH